MEAALLAVVVVVGLSLLRHFERMRHFNAAVARRMGIYIQKGDIG